MSKGRLEDRHRVRDWFPEDAEFIGANLRADDLKEVQILHADPCEALHLSAETGPTKTLLLDDIPVAMFGCGIIPKEPKWGQVWLLCTPDIVKMRRAFLRDCPKWVRWCHQYRRCLFNYVPPSNTLAYRWMTDWMGFHVNKVYENHLNSGMTFHELIKRK